jgi:SAM-dependent methyltransferase
LPTAAAAEGPPVIDEADIPTPPPRTNGAPITDSQHAAASPGVAPTEPPPGDDQREAHPTEGSLHDQASRLREAELLLNEADQVTPPPAPDKGGPKVASAAAVPVAVDEPDPGPTPPPEPVVAAPPPAPEEEAAMEATPPPVAAAGTPESEVDGVVVAIPDVALQEPELDSDRDPSLPTPVTLAEAEHQPASDGEPEDLGSEAEDIDLSDAPLDASPVAPIAIARPPTPPAIPPTASPPPIPGSVLKTPRPEVRRPEVKAEDAGDPPTGLPVFPIVPEALAQRPRRPKRSKPWFEEVFDEDYLRTLPFMTSEQTLREVSFIEESLRAAPAAEILDIGCGYGRHAIELVQRGLNVTGLDLSLPLLLRAAEEAQKRALSVNFVHADMREMPFDQKFDGAYCMLTSFGYFDEEANLRVAEGVARALKPGGRFLLDIVNRDYIVNDLPARIWWEGVGCVVLEEVDFNFHTSRVVTRRSIVFEDGRQLEHEISVRAYSLHELGRLLRQAGFRVLDISGSMAARGRFFGGTSRNLLILSEKRSE